MFGSWLKNLLVRPKLPPARVYTREGCELCLEAAQQLRQEGFPVEFVDIDDDETLQQRYGTSIPVVEILGKERFRGRVNRMLLKRIIRQELRGWTPDSQRERDAP